MHLQRIRVGRGDIAGRPQAHEAARGFTFALVEPASALPVPAQRAAFVLVLRGGAHLASREGEFALRAGDWIALDRESHPSLVTDRAGLALVLQYPEMREGNGFEHAALPILHPGRGGTRPADARVLLRLWRGAGGWPQRQDEDVRMRALVHVLATLQHPLRDCLLRCPGRSMRRKAQVFARMQRARLYLDGHLERPLRLSEMAELCSFSAWYFTKAFHAVYLEGPRSALANARLRRAAELLRASDLSVGEVGAACGFENACSFARAFRAHFGTTASDYRRLAHGNANSGTANRQVA